MLSLSRSSALREGITFHHGEKFDHLLRDILVCEANFIAIDVFGVAVRVREQPHDMFLVNRHESRSQHLECRGILLPSLEDNVGDWCESM